MLVTMMIPSPVTHSPRQSDLPETHSFGYLTEMVQKENKVAKYNSSWLLQQQCLADRSLLEQSPGLLLGCC